MSSLVPEAPEERIDFQPLMMDLAMPADPFVRSDRTAGPAIIPNPVGSSPAIPSTSSAQTLALTLSWIAPPADLGEAASHRFSHGSGSRVNAPSGRWIAVPHRRLVGPDGSGSALISSR
jgi:hypothetical protein